MPDITMCEGTNCPKKETCYRYKATPGKYRQSYFANPPIKDDGSCEHYWEVTSKSEVKRLDVQCE